MLVTGLALALGAYIASGVGGFLAAREGRTALSTITGILTTPVTVTIWAATSAHCATSDQPLLAPGGFILVFATVALLVAASLTWSSSAVSTRMPVT
jgi:hypothetical protein